MKHILFASIALLLATMVSPQSAWAATTCVTESDVTLSGPTYTTFQGTTTTQYQYQVTIKTNSSSIQWQYKPISVTPASGTTITRDTLMALVPTQYKAASSMLVTTHYFACTSPAFTLNINDDAVTYPKTDITGTGCISGVNLVLSPDGAAEDASGSVTLTSESVTQTKYFGPWSSKLPAYQPYTKTFTDGVVKTYTDKATVATAVGQPTIPVCSSYAVSRVDTSSIPIGKCPAGETMQSDGTCTGIDGATCVKSTGITLSGSGSVFKYSVTFYDDAPTGPGTLPADAVNSVALATASGHIITKDYLMSLVPSKYTTASAILSDTIEKLPACKTPAYTYSVDDKGVTYPTTSGGCPGNEVMTNGTCGCPGSQVLDGTTCHDACTNGFSWNGTACGCTGAIINGYCQGGDGTGSGGSCDAPNHWVGTSHYCAPVAPGPDYYFTQAPYYTWKLCPTGQTASADLFSCVAKSSPNCIVDLVGSVNPSAASYAVSGYYEITKNNVTTKTNFGPWGVAVTNNKYSKTDVTNNVLPKYNKTNVSATIGTSVQPCDGYTAKLDQTATDAVDGQCIPGDSLVNGVCTASAPTCPTHSHSSGSTCTCDTGYNQQGTGTPIACVPATCAVDDVYLDPTTGLPAAGYSSVPDPTNANNCLCKDDRHGTYATNPLKTRCPVDRNYITSCAPPPSDPTCTAPALLRHDSVNGEWCAPGFGFCQCPGNMVLLTKNPGTCGCPSANMQYFSGLNSCAVPASCDVTGAKLNNNNVCACTDTTQVIYTNYQGKGKSVCAAPINSCTGPGASTSLLSTEDVCTCDPNATATYSGSTGTCACNKNYTQNGNICVSSQVTCKNGQVINGQCVCPANSTNTNNLGTCDCNSGYQWNQAAPPQCVQSNNICSPACGPTQTCTNGQCVANNGGTCNPACNPNHEQCISGQCINTCTGGTLVNGQCTCPSGELYFSAGGVTNPNNCQYPVTCTGHGKVFAGGSNTCSCDNGYSFKPDNAHDGGGDCSTVDTTYSPVLIEPLNCSVTIPSPGGSGSATCSGTIVLYNDMSKSLVLKSVPMHFPVPVTISHPLNTTLSLAEICNYEDFTFSNNVLSMLGVSAVPGHQYGLYTFVMATNPNNTSYSGYCSEWNLN